MAIKSALPALTAMTAFAFAAPQAPTSYKIGLMVFGYNGDPSAYSQWYANMNQLSVRQGRSESVATHVRFGGPVYNVDINAVQCRAYGDVDGTIPVGGAFNVTYDLDLGGDPVGMYSILCYIAGEGEEV